MKNYFFQTYQFRNTCESINVSFKNVEFRFSFRTKPNKTKIVFINDTIIEDDKLIKGLLVKNKNETFLFNQTNTHIIN